jgi:hypothetical protein
MTNRTLTFAMSSEKQALAAFRALRQLGAKASLGRISGGTDWHRLTVTVTEENADAAVSVVLGIDPKASQRSG